jgi:predicted glycoside hydrolase/deacetylase ChbG (UPF0249 family)
MRYVIVNADDLGLSPGVTRGIIQAHGSGVVTSASLLVDRPASAAAARAVRDAAGLSVGVHVDLADVDARPLVDLTDPAACRAEVTRQAARFGQLVGRPPTHLDSHRNVHRRPAALVAFQQVAAAHGLPLREHTVATYVPSFYGRWDGRSHPERVSTQGLIQTLSELGPGWSEVGCHPGYVDDELCSSYRQERQLELAALTDPRVREAAAALDITFVGSSDLPAAASQGVGHVPDASATAGQWRS